jgi:hypothetical protein
VHPKVQGLPSREIIYTSRLWYLHSLPHTKGCNRALRKTCKNTIQARKGTKDSNENEHLVYIYI